MPRPTIAKLMSLVAVLAVGFAALRSGSEIWARVCLTATLAILAFAIVAVVYRREGHRAWWLGFALFGWGYAALTLVPVCRQELGGKLITSRLLMDLFQENVVKPRVAVPTTPAPTGKRAARPAAAVLAGGYEEWMLIGHSLCALLSAFAGGTAAAWLRRSRGSIRGKTGADVLTKASGNPSRSTS